VERVELVHTERSVRNNATYEQHAQMAGAKSMCSEAEVRVGEGQPRLLVVGGSTMSAISIPQQVLQRQCKNGKHTISWAKSASRLLEWQNTGHKVVLV
jgi:hypothetical protein